MYKNIIKKYYIEKGLNNWLGSYIKSKLKRREKIDSKRPIHIMLAVVDHYEPFIFNADFETAKERVDAWKELYPRMADGHVDSDGMAPQHTWFYPPHLDHVFLKDLVNLCKMGYGEIEMHLHHNHMEPFPDTSETLKQKIQKCIDDYSKLGIFCLPDKQKTFAFIHGDWSLDNSRGNQFCGVNDEIAILKELGCYADFTFPSQGKTQPKMINKMYYAKDNPTEPKSYNTGFPVRVGGKMWGDLMMIQGIIGFRWRSRIHKFKPSIESSNIDRSDYPFPKRTDYWVKNAITIKGKPNWKFIKLHTHGGRPTDFDFLIGEEASKMFSYFENNYNDGHKYILHYVTAREMYNIIKAAEAGRDGNPNDFRNFIIPRYIYLGEENDKQNNS